MVAVIAAGDGKRPRAGRRRPGPRTGSPRRRGAAQKAAFIACVGGGFPQQPRGLPGSRRGAKADVADRQRRQSKYLPCLCSVWTFALPSHVNRCGRGRRDDAKCARPPPFAARVSTHDALGAGGMLSPPLAGAAEMAGTGACAIPMTGRVRRGCPTLTAGAAVPVRDDGSAKDTALA